jgi:hypothetical protein
VRILGIDPGPERCGVVVYCTTQRRCIFAKVLDTEPLLTRRFKSLVKLHAVELVGIERVQSYGIAGGSLLRTSEVVGRLWQSAIALEVAMRLVYRREVLSALDVSGKGSRDALVRARLIEMHGGTRAAACGKKAAKGALYGVAGHSWAALAVACVVGGVRRWPATSPQLSALIWCSSDAPETMRRPILTAGRSLSETST